MCSPLLEDTSIDGATGILINITGGPDMTLTEINEAAMLIQEAADEDANIIFGSVVDANMEDQVRITVIATGFDHAHAATLKSSTTATRPEPRARENKEPRRTRRPRSTTHTTTPRSVVEQRIAAAKTAPEPKAEVVEEPAYAVAVNPAPAPKPAVKKATAATPPPAPAPRRAAPPKPTKVEVEVIEEAAAPALDVTEEEIDKTLEMAAASVTPAETELPEPVMAEEPLEIKTSATPKHEVADDTEPTPPASTTGQAQTAFDYTEETAAGTGRPHRPTGPHKVPALHPGLGSREEDKWDIPAFIRRQQRPSNE